MCTAVEETQRYRRGQEFNLGLISIISSVVFITARIDSVFVTSTAVHTYDFHMFTAIIHPTCLIGQFYGKLQI